MFAYCEGSLEDFLNHITEIHDNRLVKICLAPATTLDDIGIVNSSYHHVLDSFAVNHIMHRHGGQREYLRGQAPFTKEIGGSPTLRVPKTPLIPDLLPYRKELTGAKS